MATYSSFAAHQFSTLETAPFDPKMYSRLKFGSDQDARAMGHHLATEFFFAHGDLLLANQCVVISSPYNHLPNAATVMTKHFIDRLNELLVFAQGAHVEYTVVHRKVSYTADYGFLSKEKRRGLIDNDSFYLNRDFIKGKLLIFVDDVKITGTHEDKLTEVLQRDQVENDTMFLYFANYVGDQPDIEAALNFAAVANMADFVELTKMPNHHVIIRPIKYILSRPVDELKSTLPQFGDDIIFAMYYGCLAEGYYKIPTYQHNFAILTAEKERRSRMDR
jgi:predicted amidophosphoribosyltransferase